MWGRREAKENETDHHLHGIHRATTMLLEEMMWLRQINKTISLKIMSIQI